MTFSASDECDWPEYDPLPVFLVNPADIKGFEEEWNAGRDGRRKQPMWLEYHGNGRYSPFVPIKL